MKYDYGITMNQRKIECLEEAQDINEILVKSEFDFPFPKFDILLIYGGIILQLQGFGVVSNIELNPDFVQVGEECRNPNLGLATKARASKNAGQEGGPRDTSYTPRNARKCERMNPHTPKATPTWGVIVSMDSRIFRE